MRRLLWKHWKEFNGISIHAPTRGATASCSETKQRHIYFNPRTHTGCDLAGTSLLLPLVKFQSTHPHGVRRFNEDNMQNLRENFNPRTHTGCDTIDWNEFLSNALISIHAPTRGATRISITIGSIYVVFQSTHPHGVRRLKNTPRVPYLDISIHAPTRGATSTKKAKTQPIEISIHAPTRGATRRLCL